MVLTLIYNYCQTSGSQCHQVDIQQSLETFLTETTRIYEVETRGTDEHPTMCSEFSTTINSLAHNVSSAEAEKPCPQGYVLT